MLFDRAFVLLCVTLSGVAAFAPQAHLSASRVATCVPKVGVLFSEVEEATEAPTTEEAAAPVVEAESAAPVVEAESAAAFDTAIYVGNISFDAAESDIRAAFSEHGTVAKIQMPLDRNTGRSRGFAFVTMSNADEHITAIEGVNEQEVGGRTVYVSESLPKDKVAENKKKYNANKKARAPQGTKIYVGNLNFDTTLESLQEAFEAYGEVKDAFIPSDYDGNPRGFAFVTMDDENALAAIDGLGGTELDGRTLNVNKSLPKGTKASPRQIKLYVGNLSWGTEEGALRELFEEYGTVVDCFLPVDGETGQHRGFGFVTMDPDDALRAADETDGYELDGRILRVNEAQPKGSRTNNSYNDGYDGGDAYDEGEGGEDNSWNEGY